MNGATLYDAQVLAKDVAEMLRAEREQLRVAIRLGANTAELQAQHERLSHALASATETVLLIRNVTTG